MMIKVVHDKSLEMAKVQCQSVPYPKEELFVLTKCATINLNFSPILFISSLKNTAVRPLSVKIVQNLKFMSTKQTYELRCEVRGSRPPPKISWWLGSTELTETKESVSENFPL